MKKKVVVMAGCIICLALIAVAVVFLKPADDVNQKRAQKITLEEVKESFSSDIQALKDGEYENLVSLDFDASMEMVEGLYHLEIQSDNSYKDRTFLENFEILINTWFSRNGLGSIGPFMGTAKGRSFTYLSGVRQNEDVVIRLQDKEVKLSEMEEQVLAYLNEDFLLPFDDKITFGIANAQSIDNGAYEGLVFGIRRIYGGVPFEYGASVSSGIYTDELKHDNAEIAYTVSEYPDTLASFGRVNGKVAETGEITERFEYYYE